VYANLQNEFRYRVQLYKSYENGSNARSELYKTKHIKSYQTQLLLSLPQSVFKTLSGEWHQYVFEAGLEFGAL
jgi:hypothetical protein